MLVWSPAAEDRREQKPSIVTEHTRLAIGTCRCMLLINMCACTGDQVIVKKKGEMAVRPFNHGLRPTDSMGPGR